MTAQSSGTTTALSGGFSGALATAMIWHLHRLGVDMPPEVAIAHVTIAVMMGGAMAHYLNMFITYKLGRHTNGTNGQSPQEPQAPDPVPTPIAPAPAEPGPGA